MPSFRIPSFIKVSGFEPEDEYHMREGFGVQPPERHQPSGSHYTRVWFDSKDDLLQFLNATGWSMWWTKYEPDKSFIGRRLGSWKRKDPKA